MNSSLVENCWVRVPTGDTLMPGLTPSPPAPTWQWIRSGFEEDRPGQILHIERPCHSWLGCMLGFVLVHWKILTLELCLQFVELILVTVNFCWWLVFSSSHSEISFFPTQYYFGELYSCCVVTAIAAGSSCLLTAVEYSVGANSPVFYLSFNGWAFIIFLLPLLLNNNLSLFWVKTLNRFWA